MSDQGDPTPEPIPPGPDREIEITETGPTPTGPIPPGPDREVERGAPPIDFGALKHDLKEDLGALLGKRGESSD
jgi:hypothetical protein